MLGIDSGLTVTKSVIFDEEGHERGKGAANNVHLSPHPRWVEQDMDKVYKVWANCQGAIQQALGEAGIGGEENSGIGLAGHGDGIYLVDEGGNSVWHGILSLDSRAHEILNRWERSGVLEAALEFNG